ncbi:MAG: phage major capsid protein, partial [Gammaproteobacteria bacterium]
MDTVEGLLAALKAIIDEAEGRSLTEEEVRSYEDLEVKLATVRKDAEVRSRQTAYETPVRDDLHVHVAADKPDDTLNRAFESYLRTGRENADIVELRAQSVGTDSAGGFMVPDIMRDRLTERLKAYGGLATAVEEITTSGGEPLRWPTLDDTANTGVIAAEGTAPGSAGADLVFAEKVLGAFKYVAPGASQLPLRVSV